MCDREQAEDIVAELLSYLEKADYSIREELVSLLAEHRVELDIIHLP